MSRIPPELFQLIVENCEFHPTVYTLLFVSRDWYKEAARRLYRSIVAIGCQPLYLEQRDQRQKEMLLRLHQSPHLMANLVNLNLSSLDDNQDWGAFASPQWLRFMPAVSKMCPNLKSLHLPFHYGLTFIPPTNACFRLHTFNFDSVVKIDQGMVSLAHDYFHEAWPFLESQPEIRLLVIPYWLEVKPLSLHALPNLRSLFASIRICSWLLPNRPVEEVRLRVDVQITQYAFDGFGPLPHLKRLYLAHPLENLFWFSKSLGQLEYLEVTLVCESLTIAAPFSKISLRNTCATLIP